MKWYLVRLLGVLFAVAGRTFQARFHFTVAVFLATCAFSAAQGPGDPDENGVLTNGAAAGERSLSWWGISGKTYFALWSTDLKTWDYFPIIEPGDDAVVEWGFATTGPRVFVRLHHTDVPTSDPEGADSDLDGVSNFDELQKGTDPLSWADSDSDTLPDDWEIFYDLDPGDPADQLSDMDDDGLTAISEFGAGSDPTRRDSDRDGLSDGYESLAGTLANRSARDPFKATPSLGLIVYTPEPKPFDPAP